MCPCMSLLLQNFTHKPLRQYAQRIPVLAVYEGVLARGEVAGMTWGGGGGASLAGGVGALQAIADTPIRPYCSSILFSVYAGRLAVLPLYGAFCPGYA